MTHSLDHGDGVRDRYDVVVVGGAAAGLSGAKTLARSRRSVLVVDAGAPRNAPADGVHDHLDAEATAPGRHREIGRAEAAGCGVDVLDGAATPARCRLTPRRVAAVATEGGALSGVRMTDGRLVPRRAVVVATRLRAREDLLGGLGLAVSGQTMGGSVGTYLQAGPTGGTATAGVWGAGHLSAPRGQVIDAAAGGAGAGAAIHMDLLGEDVEVAVAAHRARRAQPTRGGSATTSTVLAPVLHAAGTT